MSETEHAGQEHAEYPNVDEARDETTADTHEHPNDIHTVDGDEDEIPPPPAVHYFASIAMRRRPAMRMRY